MGRMVLRILSPSEVSAERQDPVDAGALAQAKVIVEDVRKGGVDAMLKHAVKLGDLASATDKYILNKAEMAAAFDALPEEQRSLLLRTRDRIAAFASAQLSALTPIDVPIAGGRAGHTLAPMEVAGCYAPGGRYPLPSSVLMTAVTARTAGVGTVVVASPRPTDVTIAAAHVAGADALLCVGGAQAIAALAAGVGGFAPCDIIVGPGNKWVTAAKSLVQGVTAIDMLAGPSEVLVIADETANADVIAADMLAQAEHDTEARPILVTTSKTLGDEVNAKLKERLAVLPTRDTAGVACTKGFIVLCPDMDSAISVSDMIAPEHLEVQTKDAQAVAERCKHYGGLFIGQHAAEVLGDYGAGPNHVLPTGGTGRYTGGLSVFTFVRVRTWMRIDNPEDSQQVVSDSIQLARLEGLEGHARSAECRLR